jgi:hypothetical protein
MDPQEKKTARRKQYRKPTLKVFGDIRRLTRNVGVTGMNDSMSSAASKTGL